MPNLMTEATETGNDGYEQAAEDMAENLRNGGLFGSSEAPGDDMPTDDPEPDHVEVPEDEIGENGRRDYEDDADDLDDGGEIELDEETLLERSRQLDEIQIAARECLKARTAYEAAKKTASARKAEWEEAAERLERISLANNEPMPLFDRKPEPAAVAHDSDLNGAEGVQLATVAGFPEGVARALEDQADITTVGQLAAYSKTKDLTLLKGVGPAKADAASDAMANFWRDWNAKYPPRATDAGAAG